MAYEQKLNQGSLFKADKKTDKHPDLTGTIKLNDGDYFISAWKKTGQKGEYLSLSVKKKEAQTQQAEQPKYKVTQNDLPF
jgi:formylmethanofuran dehydrogenase subunit D